MKSGCKYMKCEYTSRDAENNPICLYDNDICRYRGDATAMEERDREIADLKEKLRLSVLRGDSLDRVKVEEKRREYERRQEEEA